MNKLAPRFSPLLAVTVVSLAAACGGNVVVDHGSSQGTGGSGGSHSSSTLSAMGGSVTTGPLVGPGPGSGGGSVTVGPGSGGNTTTTQVGPGPGPTASTGPQMCSCNTFCNDLVPCAMGQITQAQCVGACQMGQIPQDLQDCVCNVGADCNALFQQCANMGTSNGPGPGPGPGAISSVGPGPGSGGGGTGGGPPMDCTDCANNTVNGACAMQADACGQHQGCVDLINCESGCNFEPMCVNGCKMQHGPNSNMLAQQFLECAVCEQCSMECANSDLFTTACTLPP